MAVDRSFEILEVSAAHADFDLLRSAYDDVLRPSFPASELGAFEGFAAEVADGASTLIAVRERGVVSGVAVEEAMPGSTIGLLAYAATRPGLRGRGIGAVLMSAMRSRWAVGPFALVLGEVEDPRAYPPSPSNRTVDRLRFYERLGAELLTVPWVQPAIEGQPRVPGMLLLRFWPHPADHRPVPARALADWAATYFEGCEGALPSDPTYLALRNRLLEHDEVPVVDIGALEDVALLALP